MTVLFSKSDFDVRSLAELMEAIPPALPLLEVLTAIGRRLQAGKGTASEPSPYTASTQNQTVEEVCKVLNELLQGAAGAKGKKKELFSPYSGNLKAIEKIRRADIFAQFERYKDKFKIKQWQAIVLYYQMELNQNQIAKKFGIVRQAVSNLLKRAKDKKDKLDKDRRGEAYEHLRKKKKDDDE